MYRAQVHSTENVETCERKQDWGCGHLREMHIRRQRAVERSTAIVACAVGPVSLFSHLTRVCIVYACPSLQVLTGTLPTLVFVV